MGDRLSRVQTELNEYRAKGAYDDGAVVHGFDAEFATDHGRMAKMIGCYDNEWGNVNRLAELAAAVGAAPRP